MTLISLFPALDNPQGRSREAGTMACGGKQHSSLQAFVSAGRGRGANEKVCGSAVCEQWRSSFKPDIPGPAGLWHFPEKVPREGKENTSPTHPPTHSPCLLRFLGPSGAGLAHCPDSYLGGPFLLPQRGLGWAWGETLGRGRVESLWGATGRGGQFPPTSSKRSHRSKS